MTNEIANIIEKMDQVERVAPWNDRYYVNLAAARGSRANADLRTKLWIKGNVLTIEAGKGYYSDAYLADRDAVIAAVEAAGGKVRKI